MPEPPSLPDPELFFRLRLAAHSWFGTIDLLLLEELIRRYAEAKDPRPCPPSPTTPQTPL